YLIDTYGVDKLNDLLALTSADTRFDQSLREVYGFDIAGFEEEFKTALGIGGAPAPTATEPPRQQQQPTAQPTAAPQQVVPTSSSSGGGLSTTTIVLIGVAVILLLCAVMAFLITVMMQNARLGRR